MRYYDPGNWTSTNTRTCYTLANGSTDSWGTCTRHSGGTGTAFSLTPAMQRPLQY
jgi:hypothetical protein